MNTGTKLRQELLRLYIQNNVLMMNTLASVERLSITSENLCSMVKGLNEKVGKFAEESSAQAIKKRMDAEFDRYHEDVTKLTSDAKKMLKAMNKKASVLTQDEQNEAVK